MADVEVQQNRGGGGGTTWIIGLLLVVVLALVLWFTVGRPRGDDDTDINVELNIPGGDDRSGTTGGSL